MIGIGDTIESHYNDGRFFVFDRGIIAGEIGNHWIVDFSAFPNPLIVGDGKWPCPKASAEPVYAHSPPPWHGMDESKCDENDALNTVIDKLCNLCKSDLQELAKAIDHPQFCHTIQKLND